jgi:transposase
MRTKSTRDLKHEALVLTAQGRKQTAVAQELGLSTRTIQRANEKLRLHGDIDGGAQKRGPKGKLHEGMIEVYPIAPMLIQTLIAMVHYEPSATLSEYAEALEEQFDVTVSTARLSQIFAAHDINFKKVFIHAFADNSFQKKQKNETKYCVTTGSSN